MKFKCYSIPTLYKKISHKIKNCYFSIAPKSELPKANFYSGLIGCGNFVKYAYISAFNDRQNPVIISGLHSRSESSLRKAAKALRYRAETFTSCDRLLDSGIKSVIIAASNDVHYHFIIKALEKDLDVFCEKPVVNDLDQALTLKSIVDRESRILMVGFNERYFDRVKKVESFIQSGRLGEISEVQAFHNQDIEPYLRNSDWLSDVNKSGGGVLHNSGIHLINIMINLFGVVKQVSANFETKKLSKNFGEDTVFCDLVFEAGFNGRLMASCVGSVDSTYEHMIIKGAKGILVTDMLKSDIKFYDGSGGTPVDISCTREIITDSIFTELNHFYECIRDRRKPDTDINDSIDTLAVVQAARLSSEEERPVDINEIRGRYAQRTG